MEDSSVSHIDNLAMRGGVNRFITKDIPLRKKDKKSFVNCLFGFIAFGIIADAHAGNDWIYAQPPAWMSQYDQAIPCEYVREGINRGVIFCLPDGFDRNTQYPANATLYSPSTERYQQIVEPLRLGAVCEGNLCQAEGHDAGRVNSWGFRVGAVMPRGYYFYGSGNTVDQGEITAYRRGTGPLAHMYPQYPVMDTGNVFGTASSETTYDLWCSPREDLCYYTDADGQEHRLDRDDLPNYIPIATDLSDCIHEACHNANGDIIGLNPEWFP